MLDWLFDRKAYLAKREAYRELIERDADDLIARLGEGEAYAETLFRALREPMTMNRTRPKGHWYRVREVIAKKLGITIGLTGWDQIEQ